MEAELTVVVPVYNRAKVVAPTLRSLAMQGVEWPVVLVDNGSTDSTREVLLGWAEERRRAGASVIVVDEPTPGAAAARNRGLREVKTPWVLFFDSDDFMSYDHLLRVATAITRHRKADIIGWDVALMRVNGRLERHRFASRDLMFRNMFNAVFATLRYAVRTDLFRRVGAWDESVRGWDDYEVGFRLAAAGPRVVKLRGEPSVLVIEQEQSISGTDYASGAAKWEYALDRCEATLRRHGLRRELRWLELRRMVLAALYAREGSSEASRLSNEVMARTHSAWTRTLLRAAYEYTRRGGRGIHWLLRPLL